jgi:hypothetical protein
MLPALQQSYPAALTQNLPSSAEHAQLDSTAASIEGQRQERLHRVQLLHYLLPAGPLGRVWQHIQRATQQDGLRMFADARLLMTAKDLKMQTQHQNWSAMHERFFHRWDGAVDRRFLPDGFVDMGKEICPRWSFLPDQGCEFPPVTLNWRRCCLEHYQRWTESLVQPSDLPSQSSPYITEFYPLSCLRSLGSLTLETKPWSFLRNDGLLYTQFYNKIKEPLAAGKQYPFSNPYLDTLALNKQLVEAWQHIGGAMSHRPAALLHAYLHVKARCHAALQGSRQRSFGVRVDHRVTWDLLEQIDEVARRQGWTDLLLTAPDPAPYVWHHTATMVDWFQWNLNTFCTGFELVYSQQPADLVQWEHTRVMMMFLRCLLHGFGGGGHHLRRCHGLWLDRKLRPARIQEGMGMRRTLAQYGYAWFLDKVNWDAMVFQPRHRSHLMFNTPSLQSAFFVRYAAVRNAKQDYLFIQDLWAQMSELVADQTALSLSPRSVRVRRSTARVGFPGRKRSTSCFKM